MLDSTCSTTFSLKTIYIPKHLPKSQGAIESTRRAASYTQSTLAAQLFRGMNRLADKKRLANKGETRRGSERNVRDTALRPKLLLFFAGKDGSGPCNPLTKAVVAWPGGLTSDERGERKDEKGQNREKEGVEMRG